MPVTTVYVGNLPPAVDEHILQTAFQHIGSITACEVRSSWLARPATGSRLMIHYQCSGCGGALMVNMCCSVIALYDRRCWSCC